MGGNSFVINILFNIIQIIKNILTIMEITYMVKLRTEAINL